MSFLPLRASESLIKKKLSSMINKKDQRLIELVERNNCYAIRVAWLNLAVLQYIHDQRCMQRHIVTTKSILSGLLASIETTYVV
jgi:hypothetical protein